MKQSKDILSLIYDNRSSFSKGLFLVIFRVIAIIPLPWLFRVIIDDYIPSNNQIGIVSICILCVGCLLMHYAFSIAGANAIVTSVSKTLVSLRSRLFHKIQFLSFAYLDQESTGKLLSKYSFDSRKIQDTMLLIMNQCMPNMILGLSVFTLLIFMDWRLALLLLFVIPVFLIIKLYFKQMLIRENNRARLAQETLTGNANELLSAVRLFRSLGEEEKAEKKIDNHNHNFGESLINLTVASSIFGTSMFVFTNVIQLTVIAGGSYLVLQGSVSLGTLFAFVIALPTVMMPINMITQFSEQYFTGQESYESICEVLETDLVENWHGSVLLHPMQGDVKFERVHFSYPSKKESIVLSDFNLHIRPGEHIALVGESGSGKSTIANLILGLYDISSGTIKIDNQSHHSLNMREFRKNCAIVMQDNLILSGSVLDNLRIAKADATDKEIREAAIAANADEFIDQLPNGFETLMGERGVSLSGGQRQRISIARAILRNPKILILDEATSALDNESERMIQEAMDKLANGRTVVSIAHRLSTIRNADRIIVMGHGKILEQGTFKNLAKESIHFKKLLTSQIEMTEQLIEMNA